MRSLYIIAFFFNSILFSFVNAETGKVVSTFDKKPLVLQWEVSHLRNIDQISLIFKQKSVELVTNTSSYQKGQIVRLGRFESPLNSQLRTLKEQINRYYIHLKDTVPLSSLIKDSRFKPTTDPHTPVLRINEEIINHREAYFKPLSKLIYSVWNHKWTCVDCVLYEKQKKSIVRTVKRVKLGLKREVTDKEHNKAKKQWETNKQIFSKKQMNCVPKGKVKVECIDPQFGIFEI